MLDKQINWKVGKRNCSQHKLNKLKVFFFPLILPSIKKGSYPPHVISKLIIEASCGKSFWCFMNLGQQLPLKNWNFVMGEYQILIFS